MAGVRKFEDLIAWQKARVLTRSVYKVTRRREFNADSGLRDQIRRASVSVMSNIAEGHGRDGNAEFRQFLSTSKGSASEVQSHLYVALDAEYITEDEFEELYELADEAGKLIGGLMNHLKRSEMKGSKYQ